jgi:hypothetical protein
MLLRFEGSCRGDATQRERIFSLWTAPTSRYQRKAKTPVIFPGPLLLFETVFVRAEGPPGSAFHFIFSF